MELKEFVAKHFTNVNYDPAHQSEVHARANMICGDLCSIPTIMPHALFKPITKFFLLLCEVRHRTKFTEGDLSDYLVELWGWHPLDDNASELRDFISLAAELAEQRDWLRRDPSGSSTIHLGVNYLDVNDEDEHLKIDASEIPCPDGVGFAVHSHFLEKAMKINGWFKAGALHSPYDPTTRGLWLAAMTGVLLKNNGKGGNAREYKIIVDIPRFPANQSRETH